MKRGTMFKFSFLLTAFFCLFLFTTDIKAQDVERVFLMENGENITKNLKDAEMTVEKSEKYYTIHITSNKGSTYESKAAENSALLIHKDDIVFFLRYNNKNTEIVQVNPKTAEEKVIKTYGKKYYPKEAYFLNLNLAHVDENYLYYSLTDLKAESDEFKTFDMHRINLENRKTNVVAKGVDREEFTKDRMLYFDPANDLGPMNLYSVKLDGKGKKKLNEWVIKFEIIKNKIYYVSSKEPGGKYYVFSANTDFSKVKKLSNSIKTKEFDNLTIGKITDKKVYYEAFDYSKSENANHCFVIDLKTKKVKKINENMWNIIK